MSLIRLYLVSSQWNVGSTESCGMTIQSFGTGEFLSFDRSDKTDTTLRQRCHQYLDGSVDSATEHCSPYVLG